MKRLLPITGALMALSLLAASPALAKHHKTKPAGAADKEKVDSAAYPKAPGGMPATSDKGKPVEPKADASAKPAPPAKATTEGTAQKVGTPSVAYPDAPGGTPATSDGGKPVKP